MLPKLSWNINASSGKCISVILLSGRALSLLSCVIRNGTFFPVDSLASVFSLDCFNVCVCIVVEWLFGFSIDGLIAFPL